MLWVVACASRCHAEQEDSEGWKRHRVMGRKMEGGLGKPSFAFHWGDGQIYVLLEAKPPPAPCCLLP